MKLLPAIGVAMVSGYIAISYELIWYRIYSFAMESRADSFGLLLSAYLGGLAIGAYGAGWICRRGDIMAKDRALPILGGLLLAANAAAYLAVPAMLVCAGVCKSGRMADLVVIALATVLLGTVLPFTAHAALAPDERAGHKFSLIYAGNILGSVGGGLITGFWLFDRLQLQHIALLLALAGLTVSSLVILAGPAPKRFRNLRAVTLTATAVLLAVAAPALYANVYGKLHYGHEFDSDGPLRTVVETSSGVVVLSKSGVIYSGGAYEGQFNVSPLPGQDGNRVTRAYLTAAIHPRPRHVLFIGLGSGSWVQVLAHDPEIEDITVIEINPGFVRLAGAQPVVASLLKNRKVKIIIDDGRRFLKRTEKRFDLIIQNTIVYWRAHATNLLSREYIALTRSRLRPGGRLYINSTRSAFAHKILVSVFPHAMRYENMIIAGNEPVVIDRARFQRKLLQWRIDGKAVVPPDLRHEDLFNLLTKPKWHDTPTWESNAHMVERTKGLPVITDNNMATEFRHADTHP